MRRSVLAILAVVVAVSLGWSCSKAEPPMPESEGAGLYLANCASCHGQDAAGLKGPNLRTGLAADYVASTVAAGKGDAMPAFDGKLSPEQISTISDYIHRIGIPQG